jgi:hypothetical protein
MREYDRCSLQSHPTLPAAGLTCELLGTAEVSKFGNTGVSDQNIGSLDVSAGGRAESSAEEEGVLDGDLRADVGDLMEAQIQHLWMTPLLWR